MKHYAREVHYRTYQLTNRPSKNDDTVSSYISKVVKNMHSQMKAHFMDPKNFVLIIGFLATLKFACDINNIHEVTDIWVLSR